MDFTHGLRPPRLLKLLLRDIIDCGRDDVAEDAVACTCTAAGRLGAEAEAAAAIRDLGATLRGVAIGAAADEDEGAPAEDLTCARFVAPCGAR